MDVGMRSLNVIGQWWLRGSVADQDQESGGFNGLDPGWIKSGSGINSQDLQHSWVALLNVEGSVPKTLYLRTKNKMWVDKWLVA